MEVEKAIKFLKELKETMKYSFWGREYVNDRVEAIDTVLKALDERYQKGYQDGFKQAKFDCEMDKLRNSNNIEELDEKVFAECSDEGKCYRLFYKLNEVIRKQGVI